jgi:LysR family transcriptional regulator of gallate degradation
MELELKPLLNLLAIARHGSFSRAAASRNISQPALSNGIALLESRVGGRLLERGRHGAQLTDLGRTLARHAEAIEAQLARAADELACAQRSVAGPLVIGVTPVAAAHLVPRALHRLKSEMPSVAVSVIETVFSEATPALLRGAIDLMIGPIGVYPTAEGVVEEALATDPFTIIVRSGHPLGRRRAISLRQLADAQWVLPSDQSAYHHQLEALFVVAGLRWPPDCIATNSMAAMKALVIHGDCVAIMPRQLVALERRAGLIRCIRLAEAGTTRALGLSRAKDRKLSPLAERFADIIRASARERAFRQFAASG